MARAFSRSASPLGVSAISTCRSSSVLRVRLINSAASSLLSSRVTVPEVTEDRDFEVIAECFDPSGTKVATGRVLWRLGPAR